MNPRELLAAAREATRHACAQYSNYRVGAALLARSGRVYTGCNIESSSYGLTICAERVALFKALSEGEREFESIAVVVASGGPVSCCGACRQVMWDYGPDLTVYSEGPSGEIRAEKIGDMLPGAFGSNYFEKP